MTYVAPGLKKNQGA